MWAKGWYVLNSAGSGQHPFATVNTVMSLRVPKNSRELLHQMINFELSMEDPEP
jgi:hypothetical protein